MRGPITCRGSHPSLNSYSRLEDHYQITEEEDGYAGQGSTAYQAAARGKRETACRPCRACRSAGTETAEYVALFPTAVFGVHADHCFVGTLMPAGTGRTIEHVDLYYFADEAVGEGCAELRAANKDLWRGIFLEDRFVVEGMQRGRASPAYKGGVLSPALERTTHCFYRWVARKMTEAAEADGAA